MLWDCILQPLIIDTGDAGRRLYDASEYALWGVEMRRLEEGGGYGCLEGLGGDAQ